MCNKKANNKNKKASIKRLSWAYVYNSSVVRRRLATSCARTFEHNGVEFFRPLLSFSDNL
jgi:hypothetical protein